MLGLHFCIVKGMAYANNLQVDLTLREYFRTCNRMIDLSDSIFWQQLYMNIRFFNLGLTYKA